ncbi:sulfotransferase ssu-1-like [Ornithodoros turicata]|uniref:sulfotransferase ssu-1-like n=1 Tax=Ornithodoros turicata TaxID=34597 RepID=UPI00313A042C
MGQRLEKTGNPHYMEVDGLFLPISFSRENFIYATKHRPEDGDIILAGYPNSGLKTTAIMLHLLTRKKADTISSEIPLLEWYGKDVEKLARPRIIRTHLPYYRLSINPLAKYFYTVRNPKDCCAYSFDDAVTYPEDYGYLEGRFDEFLDIFLKGKVHGNDYFKHVMSWWPRRNDSHVLLMVLEDLRMESRFYLQRILGFLDRDDMVANAKNIGLLQEVLENIGIGPAPSRIMDIKMCTQDGPIARVSTAGYWKNYFTCGQSKRMDSVFVERTEGLDLRHLWNDYDVFAI